MKILKLEAAKNQLETAIKLYFQDADPISIHTLADFWEIKRNIIQL